MPDRTAMWGLAGVVLAAATGLTAFLGPLWLAASVAVFSMAATSMAIVNRQEYQPEDGRDESWEETATRIGAFFESLEAQREAGPGKFQAMVLNQERSSHYRLH